MKEDLHVPFRVAYRRPFIGKGCRKPRDEYPYASGVAVVRQVDTNDAPVAFRIEYNAGAARYSVLPSPEHALEIVSFDGRLWWPCGETGSPHPQTNLYRFTTAIEWRSRIERDRDLLKIVPGGIMPVEVESFSRVDLEDDSGETTARVQRLLFENFIVRDDTVYAASGFPVHARWRYAGSIQAVVVSTGPDRSLSELQPPCMDPGNCARLETRVALSEGDFWEPGKATADSLPKAQLGFPKIEVLNPRCIPSDLGERVHIDALFRRVNRSLAWFLHYTTVAGADGKAREKREFDSQVRDAFRAATRPQADDNSTSCRRFEALRMLFAGRRKVPKKHRATVEAIEKSFAAIERPIPTDFEPADLAALEAIA